MIGNQFATGRIGGRAAGNVTKGYVARCTGVTSNGVQEFNVATDKDNATITTPHLPVGVFAATYSSGDVCEVNSGFGSILIMVAGAATTEGRLLTFDGSGKVIDIAEVASQYVTYVGVGLKAAANDGDEIPVLFMPGFISKPSA
jgi:hypothetical protein